MFEHPDAEVFPVISGTAANSSRLAALCPPWGAVLCHETAHILQSECGATSMFGGGAVMRGVGGDNFRIAPDKLRHALDTHALGRSAPLAALGAVTDCSERPWHRLYTAPRSPSWSTSHASEAFAATSTAPASPNAIAALGCTPAELTWRAGIDALSLGAMKNGALSTDAIVCFDPAISEQLVYRVKRAGHVASKMRFQSVQLDRVPHRRRVVAARRALQRGDGPTRRRAPRSLDVELLNEPDVNMLFARLDPAAADRMAEAGLLFYRMSDDTIRLVTSFQTTDDEVDEALQRMKAALA